MSDIRLDRAREVRTGEELDREALEAYLAEHLPGFQGPLEIQQFPSGHSNLTYFLKGGEAEYVLRRPPFGARIKTAHDMGREFRILSGLHPHYPKLPKPLLHCEDESVLGAPFYVMQRLRGIILRTPQAVEKMGLSEGTVRGISESLVDGLVELHRVDLQATDLAGFGKPEGYVQRQVSGWTKRYLNAKTDEVPEVEQAAAWLAEHQPGEVGAALIHGDFKHDNLVLDPDDPTRIIGILDWEMATVGDPLMDLGTTLGYWVDPSDRPEVQMLPVGPTLAPGTLDRRQVVERYAERSGQDPGNGLFYYVYGLFKVAVIAQQIYKRFVEGHTKDPRFAMMIVGVNLLGQQAAVAIERDRIHDLG